jgi:hypothetical protein
MEIPFLTKYHNLKIYLVSFCQITEDMVDFCLSYLGAETYRLENFSTLLKGKVLNKISEEYVSVMYALFLANLEKLAMLKNVRLGNTLVDYKINVEHVMSHSNFANVDEYEILLQLFTKSGNEIYEIEENKLSEVINRLKEIYNKIKIN